MTLEKCKELRPFAKWGFYKFPECYNSREGEYDCREETKMFNDQYV